MPKNISSGNYVLKNLNNIRTTSILTTIYYSMIHPYISYGLMLWGSAYKSYLHMIEILQKKAIRNVHKTKYNEHTMPLFRSSKILKIEDMYKLQLFMFMFSYYRIFCHHLCIHCLLGTVIFMTTTQDVVKTLVQ